MRNDQRSFLRFVLASRFAQLREERRREVVEMLKSCGIPANDVPYDTPLERRGDVVTLERFVRGKRSGCILFDHDRRCVKTTEIEVRPKRIPDWIPAL